MKFLAIDFGADTGWAMWEDGVVTSGVNHLGKKSKNEGGGIKFIRFQRFLKDFGKPDLVSFEEVKRHIGVYAAHAYGGYLAVLMAWCESFETPIPYEGIPVGTIKKHATGNGSASKNQMIEAAKKKLGISPENDDEADALWILSLMCQREKISIIKKGE